MTVEEKRNAINAYCHSKRNCIEGQKYPCPLFNLVGSCTPEDKEEVINRNFELVSAMPDYYGEKEVITEAVNHPSHYNQGGIECIDAMVAAYGKEAVENFCLCNAFKYVWRNRDKNGFEDIDKAIWYLNKIKELVEVN